MGQIAPPLLQTLQQFAAARAGRSVGAQRNQVQAMLDRAILKLLKTLRQIQETHPWCEGVCWGGRVLSAAAAFVASAASLSTGCGSRHAPFLCLAVTIQQITQLLHCCPWTGASSTAASWCPALSSAAARCLAGLAAATAAAAAQHLSSLWCRVCC